MTIKVEGDEKKLNKFLSNSPDADSAPHQSGMKQIVAANNAR